MKGSSNDLALAYQHGVAIGRRQYFHAFSGAHDLRCADKYHLQRFVSQFGLGLADGAVNLPAISIATDTNVHGFQGLLRRVLDMAGQQYGASAGAESRFGGNEITQLFQKTALGQKIQKCADRKSTRLNSSHIPLSRM